MKRWLAVWLLLAGLAGSAFYLHHENRRLEDRVAAAEARTRQRIAPPVARPQRNPVRTSASATPAIAPAAANGTRFLRRVADGNPDHCPVALDRFKNVGTKTPAAAFQTLIWAALKGDQAVVDNTLVLSPEAEAKAEALLAGLPADQQAAYHTPESLVALFFSQLMLKSSDRTAQLRGWVMNDATSASLQVAFEGKANPEWMQMTLRPSGWALVVPGNEMQKIAAELIGPGQ